MRRMEIKILLFVYVALLLGVALLFFVSKYGVRQ